MAESKNSTSRPVFVGGIPENEYRARMRRGICFGYRFGALGKLSTEVGRSR